MINYHLLWINYEKNIFLNCPQDNSYFGNQMHTDENAIFAALSTLGKYKNTQDIHVLSNVISTLR